MILNFKTIETERGSEGSPQSLDMLEFGANEIFSTRRS